MEELLVQAMKEFMSLRLCAWNRWMLWDSHQGLWCVLCREGVRGTRMLLETADLQEALDKLLEHEDAFLTELDKE